MPHALPRTTRGWILTSIQPCALSPALPAVWLLCYARLKSPRFLHLTPQEERLIKNHMGMEWCRGAVHRSEARRGKPYDIVVFARPDLLWLRRVTPWCAYDSAHVLFSCPTLGCDMFWASPRQHATSLLSQAAMHRDCQTSCDHGNCCCSYSEALLIYAKRRAAEQLFRAIGHSPAFGELGWYWPRTLEYSFDPVLGVNMERGGMYQMVRTQHAMHGWRATVGACVSTCLAMQPAPKSATPQPGDAQYHVD